MAILVLSTQSWAQDDVNSYKVGERVKYQDNSKYDSSTRSYPVVWLEGTIIKLYPEYKQVVIRWDPRADYPSYTHDGVSIYQQGYTMDTVRHIKARIADKPEVKNGGADTPVNPAKNAMKDKTDGAKTADTQGGTGLMTKEEILGYMRSHGYANGQPKKDAQVCKDLIEQMKRRGVKEAFQGAKDDLSPIFENGCATFDTAVEEAAVDNQGPPPTIAWLSGTWITYVIGGTVDTAPGDGYIHRQNESIAKLGFITISTNGTYTWKVDPWDPPAKYLKGTYRMATPKEMGLYGGVGIVLKNGPESADWVVFKYQSRVPNKAERIEVEHIVSRGGDRFIGWRK